MGPKGLLLVRFIRFEVGSGVYVCLWHGWWCGYGVLNETFPELYRLAEFKEASMADYMCWNEGNIHWDITFIRAVLDREVDLLTDFLNLIYSTKLKRGCG